MGRATRQEWAKRVERWRDSGLTAKAFAAEIDVPATSLSYWKWKLRAEQTQTDASEEDVAKPKRGPRSAPTPRFLELVAKPPAVGAATMLEVVFDSGVVVRVPPLFDETTLRRVIALLGGR
jgi:transposase